jgi:hypothetical protein
MATLFSGRTIENKICDHMFVVKYCEDGNIQGEENCTSTGIKNKLNDYKRTNEC